MNKELKELIMVAAKLGKLDSDQKQYIMGWLDAKLEKRERAFKRGYNK